MFAASPAQAATIVLKYSGSSQFGPLPLNSANLVLTTSDMLNGFGGYDVLGVSGDVDGDAITGLAPTQVAIYNPSLLASCLNATQEVGCTVDQTYYPASPYFDFFGLSFQSTGNLYNLFGDGPTAGLISFPVGYPDFDSNSPEPPAFLSLSVGQLSAVPEPAAWALMLVGFAAVGVIARRRQRVAARIAFA